MHSQLLNEGILTVCNVNTAGKIHATIDFALNFVQKKRETKQKSMSKKGSKIVFDTHAFLKLHFLFFHAKSTLVIIGDNI